MEDIDRQASKNVDRTEKDILVSLALNEPVFSGLEHQLAKFRSACQDFIFIDFAAAAGKNIEARLWEAHSRVVNKFRPFLAKFREGDGKKKHVERRKAEKLFLDFVKSSMRFYRGYIHRLASHFRDVPEVVNVAGKLKLGPLSRDVPQTVDFALKKQILKSCYVSLVQLGDLSRYREMELQTKERNWGPAKGYYDLAIKLNPTLGMAYNQLAVIALTDQDHLRSVYYLYRAISVEDPPRQANGNLELKFKKIRTRSSQGEPISSGDAPAEASRNLHERFLLFHAHCLEKDFVASDDQQDEILELLADELRERPFDTIIRKFCLINIAAEECAAKKVQGDPSALQSFEILQHFNARTFSLLLKLLLDEFQLLVKGTDGTTTKYPDRPVQITATTRRLLPHLRLYSGWLLSTVPFILVSEKARMRELWRIYAEALSLFTSTFSLTKVPELPYMLDEDQDTLAFTPFSDFVRETRFLDAAGQMKPSYDGEAFDPRSSEDEMLYRIKCMVRDGIYLCKRQLKGPFESLSIPLYFADNRFNFYEDNDSQLENVSTASPKYQSSRKSLGRGETEYTNRSTRTAAQLLSHHEIISEAEVSETMERMVNNLTKPEVPKSVTKASQFHGTPTSTLSTPVAQSFGEREVSRSQPTRLTAQDLVRQMQQSSHASFPMLQGHQTSMPTLPDFLNSPFAPQPGEMSGSSPRPKSSHRFPDTTTAASYLSSSAQFRAGFMQTEHEIQTRSSSAESFHPTMSIPYESAQNHPWLRQHDHFQPQSSSWQNAFSPVPVQETVIAHRSPDPSPFGAIGDPRHKGNQVPPSGQTG
ncbi:uncharacterized protein Z518_01157 [Rhinocladiella mackenziei CBS 650.93]|uniref:DNA/RNA-binding domain-containing protein n=1 Tax=Rhinocladiella mackenziei CBS 650.93 TaxID=1442369 RepID=A0A0D2J344_9EURO|nr:uncharacterized protein Z518_01157 [Rhinocladiella mackenziei CBS 650.93]KIX10076.1 hypothetical protein Z518_01157 [Rhinocladiella mackenziei CBS 650.93]